MDYVVVDVTDESDERDVTDALVRREYAFGGISGEDIDMTNSRDKVYHNSPMSNQDD